VSKHKVVVDRRSRHEYLQKGYQQSNDSLAEHMGVAWNLLPQEDREDLMLMEIDGSEHARQNNPPRRYRAWCHTSYYSSGASVQGLDVLGPADAYEDVPVVADGDAATTGAFYVKSPNLFETPREAAQSIAEQVRAEIMAHRLAIDVLAAFLKGHEV
jgi:hypothetical protein